MLNLQNLQGENTGFKPLNPGINIPAKLTSVEFKKDKDGAQTQDLSFNFEGTDAGNQGSFNFIIWASTFDANHQSYSEDGLKRTIAQIKHILAAFMDEAIVLKVQGKNWLEFATNIVKALTKYGIGKDCKLKVILDNKDRLSFPLYPDFIVTDKTPNRILRLSNKINPKTNQPYDRITSLPVQQTSVEISSPSAPANLFDMAEPSINAGDDLPF